MHTYITEANIKIFVFVVLLFAKNAHYSK